MLNINLLFILHGKKEPGKTRASMFLQGHAARRGAVNSSTKRRQATPALQRDQSLVACLNFIRAIKPPVLLLNTEKVPPMR